MDCQIQASAPGLGVGVYSEGGGLLDRCDIAGHVGPGVFVHQASLLVRSCRIHDGLHDGLLVGEGGRVVVEECDVFANHQAGLSAARGGHLVAKGCKVRDGKHVGILIADRGRAVLEGCEVAKNALAGIQTEGGGDTTARGCIVRDGGRAGIVSVSGGRGSLENCTIRNNALAGLIVDDGEMAARKTKVQGNQQAGVWVLRQGAVLAEDCDLGSNQGGAWCLAADAVVRARGMAGPTDL